MTAIPYTVEDIKNAKINLVNQKLTSFQSAILFQHIDNLEQRIKKAIEKLYAWGEALDPDFQSEMLSILQDEKVDD